MCRGLGLREGEVVRGGRWGILFSTRVPRGKTDGVAEDQLCIGLREGQGSREGEVDKILTKSPGVEGVWAGRTTATSCDGNR